MPFAPPRACLHSGCGALNCVRHGRAASERARKREFDAGRREDPLRQLYRTPAWRRARVAVLARDPICTIGIVCVRKYGYRMPSTDVDHKVSTRSGGATLALSNLRGACHACHSHKTATEDADFARSHKT